MRLLRHIAVFALCFLLLLAPRESRADSLHNAVVAVFAGVIVGTAAITIAVVLLVKHKPSITGCAVATSEGLSLRSESEGKTYLLRGDLASLAEGRRVRLNGSKHEDGSRHEFTVKHVTKNFGPCAVAPAA